MVRGMAARTGEFLAAPMLPQIRYQRHVTRASGGVGAAHLLSSSQGVHFFMATALAPRRAVPPQIRQTQLFIDGQWVPARSGKTFATLNPATEEVIAQVAEGDAADVELAVRAARRAFDEGPWPRMNARERGRIMMRLADLIEMEIDELAALESDVFDLDDLD